MDCSKLLNSSNEYRIVNRKAINKIQITDYGWNKCSCLNAYAELTSISSFVSASSGFR